MKKGIFKTNRRTAGFEVYKRKMFINLFKEI